MVDRVTEFERNRSRLRGLAYRMLGSLDEAQDIVQEAYLRWHRADVEERERFRTGAPHRRVRGG